MTLRITLGNLRRLLRESSELVNLPRPVSSDSRGYGTLANDVVPELKRLGLLPSNVGKKLGSGFQGVVFELGSNQVIKMIPMWTANPARPEFVEENVNHWLQQFHAAPSGGLYVKIFDSGVIRAFDPIEQEQYPVVVYATMERLQPLSKDEERQMYEIFQTKSLKISDVTDEKFKKFLEQYATMAPDTENCNAMKRGDEYVIIDQA